MSCNYAEGLSYYENKGKLGQPERFANDGEVEEKVELLAKWLKESQHTVFHTGAGISTSAGIPDFRGPNGVWTLEKKGLKPNISLSWDDARPTYTHMAITALAKAEKMDYVITQNIDGLHLRSGLPRRKLAELHGNMFVDKCNYCHRYFVRSSAVNTVGQKSEGVSCLGRRGNGRRCRGKLYDTILDWEHDLPGHDLDLADMHSCAADLSVCLGTSLQIIPSGKLPINTKKRGGKLVICNLQPTKQDRQADLIINTYVDDVMKRLLVLMEIDPIPYSVDIDPVKISKSKTDSLKDQYNSIDTFEPIDWTIPDEWLKDKELNNKVKSRKIIRIKRNKSAKVDSLNVIASIKKQKSNNTDDETNNILDESPDCVSTINEDVTKNSMFAKATSKVSLEDDVKSISETNDNIKPSLKLNNDTKSFQESHNKLKHIPEQQNIKSKQFIKLNKNEVKSEENGSVLTEVKYDTNEVKGNLKDSNPSQVKFEENDVKENLDESNPSEVKCERNEVKGDLSEVKCETNEVKGYITSDLS